MKSDYQQTKITKQLLDWYRLNGRNLPWRATKDPYKIWLSEIILQQTRVDQGLDYYLRFQQKYPTVGKLAADSTDNVLKMWQGLGYYSRARNLHFTAQFIHSQYKGKFPATYKELLGLKGVGSYTAAAIASIAFNEPVAVLDGNVYRLLSRYYGIYTPIDGPKAKAEFTQIANSIVSLTHPGDFNQAMMDFGAMVCTPKNPQCEFCPLAHSCYANAHKKTADLPVKSKKIKITQRFFHYLYVTNGKQVFIQQRLAKDIWQNLYELPLIEGQNPDAKQVTCIAKQLGIQAKHVLKNKVYEAKHQLSHQTIYASFYVVEVDSLLPNQTTQVVDKNKLSRLAVSRLTEKFFDQYQTTKNKKISRKNM